MSVEVDTYLAACRPDQAAALQTLRALIKLRLPDHIECLSYAMPGFRQPGPKGCMVAGYAADPKNCGYYPHSGNIVPQFATALTQFKTTPDHPIPDALILRLIDARRAELALKGH